MRGIGYNISEEMTTPIHNGIAGARLRARCGGVSPRAFGGGGLRRTRVGALYAASAAIPAGGLLREVRDRSPRVFLSHAKCAKYAKLSAAPFRLNPVNTSTPHNDQGAEQ